MSRRVTLVTAQLLGFGPPGGVGAATTWLALALGRMGHDVDVLFAKEQALESMDAEWAGRYAGAGVGIRVVPTLDVTVEPKMFARMRATVTGPAHGSRRQTETSGCRRRLLSGLGSRRRASSWPMWS